MRLLAVPRHGYAGFLVFGPTRCPRCSSRDTVKIVYGAVTPRRQLQAGAGQIRLGGAPSDRVVNLLPERSQESLVAWLKRHPEVETATRDRSNIYREALAKSAPEAVQVADRWHLMHNLALVLEEFLLQKGPAVREVATPEAAPEDRSDDAFGTGPVMPNRSRNHDRKVEEAARRRHERLVRQGEDIRRLYLAGADLRRLCRVLGISARTVYRYKDLEDGGRAVPASGGEAQRGAERVPGEALRRG